MNVKREYVILGGATVLSFTAGAVSSYYWTKKKHSAEYDVVMEREIDHARDFYAARYKREAYETPEKAAEALIPENVREAAEALSAYQGETEPEEIDEVVEEVKNVFEEIATSDDGWDYAVEVSKRNHLGADVPYIISRDEFMENESGFEQTTITYYEGDDVLADDKDQNIPGDTIVGDEALVRFGHGSQDNNVVYVRNEKLSLDFEILRSTGKYAEEVLGFKHSDRRPKIRKFRGDDE